MSTARKKKDEEEEHDLTDEQEAELEERMAEIERGDWVDGDVVQHELRRRLTAEGLAELDEAIAEADRGEGVSAEDVLYELRAMRDEILSSRA